MKIERKEIISNTGKKNKTDEDYEISGKNIRKNNLITNNEIVNKTNIIMADKFVFIFLIVFSLAIVVAIILIGIVYADETDLNANVNVLGEFITIYSPVDGATYNTKRILLNVSLNELAELSYSLDGIKYKILCKKPCQNYAKLINFLEGLNNLRIRAKTSSLIYETNVVFSVDSIMPKIKKTTAYAKSSDVNFSVVYDELNPVKVFLYYGNNITNLNNIKEFSNCLSRKNAVCSSNVDLSAFNGQYVYYKFQIQDFFYSAFSKTAMILVNSGSSATTETSEETILDSIVSFLKDAFGI